MKKCRKHNIIYADRCKPCYDEKRKKLSRYNKGQYVDSNTENYLATPENVGGVDCAFDSDFDYRAIPTENPWRD